MGGSGPGLAKMCICRPSPISHTAVDFIYGWGLASAFTCLGWCLSSWVRPMAARPHWIGCNLDPRAVHAYRRGLMLLRMFV